MRRLSVTIVLFLTAIIAMAQTEIRVEAPNVVAADEQFNVTFIIEGDDNPSDFEWNSGPDFQVLWGPQSGRSTSIQIINGKRSKSVQTTYTYVLRPVATGQFSLPQATAKIKGKQIVSSSYPIQVASAGASSSSRVQPQSSSDQSSQTQRTAGVQDDDIFMKLELSRSKVVVGEPITAVLKLYQRVNIAGFENVTFPTFNGFWSQEVEAPTNIEFSREVYDGQIYNAALLRKFTLIPQQQGKIKIDPAELVCLVNVRVSSGGTSIFDGFFDDYRTIRRRVSTPAVTVDVSPLPAGAPASFAGGVGTFDISARISKDTLRTHEAASLVITVSGKGNVSLLEAPKVKFPPDMEVYDTKVSDRVDKGGLSGSKIYEYPFIPRSHGDFVIDPVKYSYYDVNKGRYVTLETSPIAFHVIKGKDTDDGVVIMSGTSGKDVKSLASDIRFISTKRPDFSSKGQFFVGSLLFNVIWILILLCSFLSWLVFRKMAARKADIAGIRNRKATKMALKRLRQAGTFLKQNLYTAFYEELHKALLGFISDKLNMPVSELSRDKICESLKEGNVKDEYISTFIGILDACEFARYSPAAGHDAMEAHYKEALDVISAIDSDMKTKRSVSQVSVLTLILLTVFPASLSAQTDSYVDSLWNVANVAYSEGRWSDAVDGYERIVGMGLESASLYCNTGDAFFKEGNIPMAILYYERALKVDPSYSDAEFNLNLLNQMIQDRIDPVPEFILKAWARDLCYAMDSDSWAICFLVLLSLTLAMILLYILAPTSGGRRAGFLIGIVTLLLAAASLSFSLWQKKDYNRADDAIIMRPVTSVKSSPSAESSMDLFILHEGTKVKILDSVGSWNNIELADGRQGWLDSSDMEII